MKHNFRGSIVALVLLFGTGIGTAQDDVTLKGSFVWNHEGNERTGDLKAVFTPDGQDSWTVAFHFVWEDEPHVYDGTATGNLSHGPLKGVAEGDDESHKLSFRFEGTVNDGTFEGTHGYLRRDGSLKDAGTLRLSIDG